MVAAGRAGERIIVRAVVSVRDWRNRAVDQSQTPETSRYLSGISNPRRYNMSRRSPHTPWRLSIGRYFVFEFAFGNLIHAG
jgi:hypothetical protein